MSLSALTASGRSLHSCPAGLTRSQAALALALVCTGAEAGPQSTSARYTNGPGTMDFGGGQSAGGRYSQTAGVSETAGTGTDVREAVTAGIGYAAQLYGITSLLITATPPILNEGEDSQLSATALLDDASVLPLPGTSVTWSVVSGPLFGISVTGLTTAENVSQDAAAIVGASYAGVHGSVTLTIQDSIPDNFGTYAGDGIHDGWQTRHFGANPVQGGAEDDPDHDGVSNFAEYAFGMTPTRNDSGPVTYSGTVMTSPGLPTTWMEPTPGGVDLRAVFVRRTAPETPVLRYTVQFSADLASWQNSAAVPDIRAAGVGVEVVSVRYPLFLNNGRKARFFRVQVETVTPTP